MPKTDIVTFRLNVKDRKLLAAIANKLQTSKTQAVRILIREGVKEPFSDMLSSHEIRALNKLAEIQRRAPHVQAALIIREKLAQEGLIELKTFVYPIEQNSESNQER